jgi:hypothetical protein
LLPVEDHLTRCTAPAPAPAGNGNLETTIRDALAATLQKQITLFNDNQALVKAATTGEFDNNNNGQGSQGVSQDSLTVDGSVIQVNAFQNGGDTPGAEGGQALVETSQNNFANCSALRSPLRCRILILFQSAPRNRLRSRTAFNSVDRRRATRVRLLKLALA